MVRARLESRSVQIIKVPRDCAGEESSFYCVQSLVIGDLLIPSVFTACQTKKMSFISTSKSFFLAYLNHETQTSSRDGDQFQERQITIGQFRILTAELEQQGIEPNAVNTDYYPQESVAVQFFFQSNFENTKLANCPTFSLLLNTVTQPFNC